MNGEQTFIIYSFLLGFLIPLILISIFYVLVILRLQHLGPKRTNPGKAKDGSNQLTVNQQSRAKDRKKSHRKVTKLVLTVITVYFVCWAPYWISQVKYIYIYISSVFCVFIGSFLSFSNSIGNNIKMCHFLLPF